MLTNLYNLPLPIFEAIKNDPYDAGNSDLTVTQLINAPRIVELSRRHREILPIEAAERLWATYGQLMHLLLERAVESNPTLKERYLTENRLFAEVEGWKISGQFDLYDKQTNTLSDYKFVGGYAVKLAMKEGKVEWAAQLNCLRWLFWKQTGILPERLSIVGLVRDFTKRSLKEGILPAQEIEFKPWHLDTTESFIKNRVKFHQEARGLRDPQLPLCEEEERWLRKGLNTRCLEYCDARTVCDFALQLNKNTEEEFT